MDDATRMRAVRAVDAALYDADVLVDEDERRFGVAGLCVDATLGVRPSLEGPGQARREDPPTATSAALSLGKPEGKRYRVLAAVAGAGERGLTGEEAVEATGIEYRTVTPRIGELKRLELVRDLPDVTRPGTHGVDQKVVVATAEGRAALGLDPPGQPVLL